MTIIADVTSHLIVGFVWAVMIVGLGYAVYVSHQRRMARVREYERRHAQDDHEKFVRHSENVARKALWERVNL